jgi:hypothetical protein
MIQSTIAFGALVMALLGAASAASAQFATSGEGGRLELVATFEHQVTGVTVASDGRIFVNFPRWTEDAPISVAELTPDGEVRPYPDADWNAWRNVAADQMTPGDHFVCVQSVVADARGNLWVVDPAAPGQGHVVQGEPSWSGSTWPQTASPRSSCSTRRSPL